MSLFDNIDVQDELTIVQKIARKRLPEDIYQEHVTNHSLFDIYYVVEKDIRGDIFSDMKRWSKKHPIIRKIVDAYCDRLHIESLPHVALVCRHPVYEHVIIHTHDTAPKTKTGIWYQCDSSLPFKMIYVEPLKEFISAYGNAYGTED